MSQESTKSLQDALDFLVQCILPMLRGVFTGRCVLLVLLLVVGAWLGERFLRWRGWIVVRSTVRGEALQTERRSDGRRTLLRDLTVEAGGYAITVPRGFVTDYSSIPWFGRWLVRWSKVDVAGVVHDYLYWCARGTVPALASDWIWKEIAGSGDRYANVLQRWLAWMALALGGRVTYRKAGRKLRRPDNRKPAWIRNRCPVGGKVERSGVPL